MTGDAAGSRAREQASDIASRADVQDTGSCARPVLTGRVNCISGNCKNCGSGC